MRREDAMLSADVLQCSLRVHSRIAILCSYVVALPARESALDTTGRLWAVIVPPRVVRLKRRNISVVRSRLVRALLKEISVVR
jgi:hypothetical protein